MRLKKVRLKQFKRFDDLTIDLGDSPKKIIALVGPNGCGKSSIFDAFEEKAKDIKGGSSEGPAFFSKRMYSSSPYPNNSYSKHESIELFKEDGTSNLSKKSFYIRSPYRFSPKINLQSITSGPPILDDSQRPSSSISLDRRMLDNYALLQSELLQEFDRGTITGLELRKKYVDKINQILEQILDIRISSLGAVSQGKGQLFFEKDTSKNFPYDNLSSGEKEVVDLILDLVIKTKEFDDTVYCIDEPELHLNTAIQRKLLVELDKLIPDTCQLWVATHSLGFLRALQTELKDDSAILDFSQGDFFNGTKSIAPIRTSRANWQRIFQTALEDLTGLIAPKRIVYCEGKLQNSLDEKMFNQIFEDDFPDTIFVSSGNKDDVQRYSAIALTVLNKAFSGVQITALIDKDTASSTKRDASSIVKILVRREFENYLLDREVLERYCNSNGTSFESKRYSELIRDSFNDDVKAKASSILKECCQSDYTKESREKLASLITKDTAVYSCLKTEIFN